LRDLFCSEVFSRSNCERSIRGIGSAVCRSELNRNWAYVDYGKLLHRPPIFWNVFVSSRFSLRDGNCVGPTAQPGITEESEMSKMPLVPPEQRSNKGPGSDPNVQADEEVPARENFDQQGRHGNIKQNTTNQGYQQDR
jgi:hypothetical protein